MDVLKEYDETWKIPCVLRNQSHNYILLLSQEISASQKSKALEQKYFPKRFPHKISSEAIKNNQMDVLKEYDEKMKPLRRIVGVAMEVYNEWGAGLLESAYEAGMKHLLDKDPTIKVERQKPLPMYWKDEQLEDHYRMDLVINDVIVELKACKFVSNEHERQLHNYMRLTKTTYGLLINFSDKQVFSEAFKLYPDGNIEKVPLKMTYTIED